MRDIEENLMKTKIDVVCGVIIENGKVLITQRGDKKNFGKWEFAGGKINSNESPEDAIIREVKEELNLIVEVSREITRYNFQEYNLIFMLCFISGKNSLILNEHLNYRWIDTGDVASSDFVEGDRKFIESIEFKRLS